MAEREHIIRIEDPVLGTVDRITTIASESMDEFIFETIGLWWAQSTKLSITKKELAEALTNYKQPLPAELEGGGTDWWHVCGACHGTIRSRDTFCRHCGRRVLWEEHK